MSKTIKALINTGNEQTNKTFDVVQGNGAKGKPTTIKAVKGARYHLEDPAAKNVGPENIRSKRVGKNLHVMLDGSNEADLIIEDYFDKDLLTENNRGLYGRAEDGKLYEYIPEDPTPEGMPINLADGGRPVSQVLGGGQIGEAFELSGLVLVAAGGGFSALTAGAAVVGGAALAGGGGGGGGSNQLTPVQLALAKIEAYNNGDGTTPAALTVQDYVNAGITGVTADNLAAVNANVLAQNVGGADTAPEVQALVTLANSALVKIEAYNNGDGVSPPALTLADYAAAGITGVTAGNLAAVNANVLAQSLGGADTVPEVQALVTAANNALAKIEAYNNGDGTTPAALTPADYAAAGITGVTPNNVTAINAKVLAQNKGGADTVPEVQNLVNGISDALAKIEAYNNGNGITPVALTVQDYVNAGITDVTPENLAAVNAQVLKQTTGGADTIPEVQALVAAANSALAKIEAYNNGNGTSPAALTIQDYAAAGITGVTVDNLAAVNAQVLKQTTGGADTIPEVQALVTAANNALAKIEAYNNGNGTSPAALTLQDYLDAGITGVNADNLATVNAKVLAQSTGGADTVTEVQALVNDVNFALVKIEAYNNGDGITPVALTVQDYANAGITGVTAENLAAVNAKVLAQNVGGADTIPEVQALVTAANSALAKIEAYNNGDGTTPAALTPADYAAAGITGVTTDNIAAVNAKVLAQSTGGADTVGEVQSLVNGISDALAKIEAYNNGNGITPVALTVQDYANAGITGVTAGNLAAVNATVLLQNTGGADTIPEVQALVTGANAALAKIEAYNNGDGTNPPALTPADYAAAGITGVTVDNLAAVNAQVLKQAQGGANTAPEVQNLVAEANAALAKIEAYNNGDGTNPPALTPADYAAAGITGVTTDNIAAVNAQVLKQTTGGADTVGEVQALVTGANSALAKIEAYNNGNGTSPAALTVDDYAAAGITGVTAENLAAVNAQVLKQTTGGADTATEVQNLVTAANAALAKIEAYNNGNGTTPPALSVEDYAAAGITGVTAGNLAAVNAKVLAQSQYGADTVGEVQALVTGANSALDKIEAYNNGNGTSPAALTVDDYAAAGITGVTAENLAAVNAQVLKQTTGGADTATEVQNLVTAANTALAKIEDYNNGNGTSPAALTVDDYAAAGITGVTPDNLAAVNAQVLKQTTGGANSTAEVQNLVTAANAALAKIEDYNKGNGTTPSALTVEDYAAAGITGVTPDNLAAVNAQVLKQTDGGADTVTEVQNLVTAANAALAKIEAYNNGNGTTPPALSVEDYAAAGITGVTAGNLTAVNANVLAQTTGGADTAPEVQALVATVTATALSTIANAATLNNAGTTPSVADFATAGVTGVTSANLAAISSALNTGAISGAQASTTAQVQTIVDAYQAILGEANDTNNTHTNPTAEQYAAIGVNLGSAPETLGLLNSIVSSKSTTDIDTADKLQELTRIASAIQLTAAGGTPNPALTVADLQKIGINTTGVTAANLPTLLAAIAAKNNNGTDTDSLSELQAIVAGLDKTAPVGVNNTNSATEDTGTQTGNVKDNDTSLDGTEKFVIEGSAAGQHGTLVLDQNTGAYTYTYGAGIHAITANVTDTFTYRVTDAAGNTSTATLAVTVTPVNDAAVITTNSVARSYTENAAAILANNNLTLSDVDSTNLTSATVQITTGLTTGDTLAFASANGITGSYDAATGKLTLTGPATVAQYQAALQSVTYSSTSENPTNATRTLSWQVDDGQSVNHASNVGTSTIAVTPDNDAPTGAVTISGNTAVGSVLTATTSTVADVEGLGSLSYSWYADGAVINGATGSTYTLASADAGKTITAKVSYTDGGGTAEQVTSAATAAVTAVTPGQAVVDLGTYGKLIAPIQVGGDYFYYWDRSGNGKSSDAGTANGGVDYTTHNVLDAIFNKDINGVTNTTVLNADGLYGTTDVYRYGTINGVLLALPSLGTNAIGNMSGTTVSNNTTTVNPTYGNTLLGVWDSVNNTSTSTAVYGAPTNWATGDFWSATATIAGHATVDNFGKTSNITDIGNAWVALQMVKANTAPVLDAAQSPALTAVSASAAVPTGAAGDLVSTLVGGISDTDAGATKGIAITGVHAGATLYYSTNGGTWTAASGLSNTNALLLAADSDTRVFYKANNTSGTISDAITFRAWDMTANITEGVYTDTTANGGKAQFSEATDTVSVESTDPGVAQVQAAVMSLYLQGYNQTATGITLYEQHSSAYTVPAGTTITLHKSDGTVIQSYAWSPGAGYSTNFTALTGLTSGQQFYGTLDYNGVSYRLNQGLQFNGASAPTYTTYGSPLVLDLNGDGVHTLAMSEGVSFDVLNTGSKQTVGWVEKHDGLLAIDLNGDGQINSGAELFGDHTQLANGTLAKDGWAALAVLDTNADGKVDANDAGFDQLRVWVDANSDGVTDAGELLTLAQAKVASINLHADTTQTMQNGNWLEGFSSYTSTDGVTHEMVDAWLQMAAAGVTTLKNGESLDLASVSNKSLVLGVDMSVDTAANTVKLSLADVLGTATTNGMHTLTLTGEANDTVNLDMSQWANSGNTVTQGEHTYAVYNASSAAAAQLLIDQHMVLANHG